MSEWFFLCSIALKRHACQGAVGPVPPPPSEDKLCQQQQYVKKTGKKVAKKRAKSATKVPSPPCYLCNKQFMGLRRIKEHYILVHFEAEFRVKYTQGKKLSSSEHAQCLFCPYGGNTRDLAFHVGIVHEKVRDYLPDNVWTDLFGHQGIKLNTSHDQESPVGGPTPPPEQQQQQQQPSKKTKKKKKRPASRMPGGQENIPACHLCNRGFTRLRLLKLHYIRAHYSAELRAKYMKGKQISQKISGQCELCPYAGTTRELVLHVGIVHRKLKEHLPERVWISLFGHREGKGPMSAAKPTVPLEDLVQPQQPPLPRGPRKRKPAAWMPDGRQIPACHMCSKRFTKLRCIKQHYILAHYAAEFKADHTPGKKISKKVAGKCQLCSYAGTTWGVALHVGIAHGMLKNYMPQPVWSSLFGHQLQKFKPAYDEEGRLIHRTVGTRPAGDIASKKTKKTNRLGSSRGGKHCSAAHGSAASNRRTNDVTTEGHSASATGVTAVGLSASASPVRPFSIGRNGGIKRPAVLAQPSPSSGGGAADSVPKINCHLCDFRGKRDVLRRHYLTHYKVDMYAMYSKTSQSNSSSSKKVPVSGGGLQEQCEFCQFRGQPRALIEHIWTAHKAIKKFVPDSVWRQIKQVQLAQKAKARRKAGKGFKLSTKGKSSQAALEASVADTTTPQGPSAPLDDHKPPREANRSSCGIGESEQDTGAAGMSPSVSLASSQKFPTIVDDSHQNGVEQMLPPRPSDIKDEAYDVEMTGHNTKMWECIYCASETRRFDR